MRLPAIALALVLSLIALRVFPQGDSVIIRLTVRDSYFMRPLSGVNIIDPKSSTTVTTDSNGFYQGRIKKSDFFFLFYPGYQTARFTVADSAPKPVYVLHFVMEPLSTGLSQPVIIRAPKTLEQIEEERKKLGITPEELKKNKVDAFASPIGALYEALSKQAHEKAKLSKQIAEDERRQVFKELLNYYNQNDLIYLPEGYYDDFINYCNLPLEFLKNNTDYDIAKKIVTLYNKYGRLNGLIK